VKGRGRGVKRKKEEEKKKKKRKKKRAEKEWVVFGLFVPATGHQHHVRAGESECEQKIAENKKIVEQTVLLYRIGGKGVVVMA
jgi:hypothetical protein